MIEGIGPQLVTLAEDEDYFRGLIEPGDYSRMMSGAYSEADLSIWREKYPELMGILPIIPAVAAMLAKTPAGQKIASYVKARITPPKAAQAKIAAAFKPKAPAKPAAPVPPPAPAGGAAGMLKNPLVLAGAAGAALLLFTMMGKRKRA